jgi:hypothetical protein
MESERSYSLAWRKYRELRWAALVSVLVFFPFLAAVTIIFNRMHWNEYVGLAFDAAYLLWMFFANVRFALWPCPRCGKSFRGLRPYSGNHCFYCNLLK